MFFQDYTSYHCEVTYQRKAISMDSALTVSNITCCSCSLNLGFLYLFQEIEGSECYYFYGQKQDKMRLIHYQSFRNSLSKIRQISFSQERKIIFFNRAKPRQISYLKYTSLLRKIENYLRYLSLSSAGEQQIFKNSLLCI